jgi:hypothetical protein
VRSELDAASAPERQSPYYFFEPTMQGSIHGAAVGDKPAGYRQAVLVAHGGASVTRADG